MVAPAGRAHNTSTRKRGFILYQKERANTEGGMKRDLLGRLYPVVQGVLFYWVGCFVSAFCIAIAWHWEWRQRAGNALRVDQDE